MAGTECEPPAPALDDARVQDIFSQALECPEGERDGFIEQACAGHDVTSARVRQLLWCADRADQLLESPSPLLSVSEPGLERMGPGHIVGPYRIVRRLGAGGMGTVWLAERADDQFRMRVALKLVRQGMDTDELIARFRRERQLLAGLDHPNIAHLLDGGQTHDGLPYLVEEYVDGVPIDQYCARHGLTPGEVLRLIRPVCEAVQHAHRSLIVHRDLKPGNILVTAEGVPKLLDFGIAKLLSDETPEAQEITLTRAVAPITPAYASPEQLTGGALTTVADVYSLGVVLYRLITGRLPHDAPGAPEPRPTLPRREPRPPSLLARGVDAEIDAIVLKAMDAEPALRYASAEALAADITRYLNHEPLEAKRRNRWYVIRKQARRHRVALTVVAGFVLLLAGSSAAGWRLYSMAQERLAQSFLAQAKLGRQSGTIGQRFQTLDAIGQGAAIRPSLALRNEAIAAMAKFDVRVVWRWPLGTDHLTGTFDDDLKRIAVAEVGGDMVIRSVPGAEVLVRLPAEVEAPQWFGFSPDGAALWVTCPASKSRPARGTLWNLSSARPIVAIENPSSVVAGGFSADGRLFAVATGDNIVRLLDTTDGSEVHRLEARWKIGGATLRPDGRQLAVVKAGTGTVSLFDLDSPEPISELQGNDSPTTVAWSPDGSMIAIGSVGGRIYLWDAATRTLRRELTGHLGNSSALWFDRSGDLLVSYSSEGMTRFWDTRSGVQILQVPGVIPRAFSRDNRFLAFRARAGELGIWELAPREAIRRLPEQSDRIAIDPGGRVLAIAQKEHIALRDLVNGALLATLPAEDCAFRFHPQGKGLLVFDTRGRYLAPLQWLGSQLQVGPPAPFWTADRTSRADTAGGRFVASIVPGGALLLALDSPSSETQILAHENGAHVTISPDGAWVATGTFHGWGVRIWDARSRQMLIELTATEGARRDVVAEDSANVLFSPDGRWLVTASVTECSFWETGSWKRRAVVRTQAVSDTPPRMAFNAEGTVLAITLTPYAVQLLDVATSSELAVLTPPTFGFIQSLEFSPDGTCLVTAGGAVLVWDLLTLRAELNKLHLDWPGPSLAGSRLTSR